MAGGLSDAQLASMRACETAFMPDLVTVHRPVLTKNATGSYTSADSTPYVALPCEATPKILRQLIEHEAGAEVQSAVRWDVTVPSGTDIRLDDQLWVTPHGTGTVLKLDVNGVLGGISWETAVVAECLLVA